MLTPFSLIKYKYNNDCLLHIYHTPFFLLAIYHKPQVRCILKESVVHSFYRQHLKKRGRQLAKYLYETTGDFNAFVGIVHELAQDISSTTIYEDGYRFGEQSAMMVYERYSIVGSSRVSLSVMITEFEGKIQLVAIPSGGSQAIVLKINNWGEGAFLDEFKRSLEATNEIWQR